MAGVAAKVICRPLWLWSGASVISDTYFWKGHQYWYPAHNFRIYHLQTINSWTYRPLFFQLCFFVGAGVKGPLCNRCPITAFPRGSEQLQRLNFDQLGEKEQQFCTLDCLARIVDVSQVWLVKHAQHSLNQKLPLILWHWQILELWFRWRAELYGLGWKNKTNEELKTHISIASREGPICWLDWEVRPAYSTCSIQHDTWPRDVLLGPVHFPRQQWADTYRSHAVF